MTARPIVHPTEVEWEFGGKTYVQEELSIEGEMRLAQVLGACAVQLINEGFPVDRIADIVVEDPVTHEESPDLQLIIELATQALGIAPTLAVDTALVMLGVFPKNEDGTLNPQYDDIRKSLRAQKGGIKFSSWIEMVEIFAQQNDLQRLVNPFVKIVQMTLNYGVTMSGTPIEDDPKKISSPPSTSSSPKATASRKKSSGAIPEPSSTTT